MYVQFEFTYINYVFIVTFKQLLYVQIIFFFMILVYKWNFKQWHVYLQLFNKNGTILPSRTHTKLLSWVKIQQSLLFRFCVMVLPKQTKSFTTTIQKHCIAKPTRYWPDPFGHKCQECIQPDSREKKNCKDQNFWSSSSSSSKSVK